jgi:hypothetical protein
MPALRTWNSIVSSTQRFKYVVNARRNIWCKELGIMCASPQAYSINGIETKNVFFHRWQSLNGIEIKNVLSHRRHSLNQVGINNMQEIQRRCTFGHWKCSCIKKRNNKTTETLGKNLPILMKEKDTHRY